MQKKPQASIGPAFVYNNNGHTKIFRANTRCNLAWPFLDRCVCLPCFCDYVYLPLFAYLLAGWLACIVATICFGFSCKRIDIVIIVVIDGIATVVAVRRASSIQDKS